MQAKVSVLFVAKDSVYKNLGVDCWDEDRNALNWAGGNPIVAHPPCRLFCRMSHMSTAPIEEKQLAYWAVDQVRKWGGVLEHPAHSKLWKESFLPFPGQRDSRGFTKEVEQYWWGHPAKKKTWLYISGLRSDLPEIPYREGEYLDIWGGKNRKTNGGRWSGVRSATPLEFAKWLISTAEKCYWNSNTVDYEGVSNRIVRICK